MRKLIVTGGCGFIGCHYIREVLTKHRDIHVINVDKLTYSGQLSNVKRNARLASIKDIEAHPRYTFIKADICDRPKMLRILEGAWGIVNFAAETHVDRSIVDATVFLRTNILGTQVLLDAARSKALKRFLQVSTDEVYGSLVNGDAREDNPIQPNNPYSASKAAADCLVRSYFVTYKLPALIVRSSNNFGPFQYPEKVIPLFVTNLISGRKVPLYGHGEHQRDWLYVGDNVRAIDLVLHKGKVGEIYNIGAGRPISNLSLTKRLLELCGRPQSFIRRVTDRPGHDFRYSLNIDKIRRLGFRPQNTFDKALKQTVRWYQENPDWWRPLKNNSFTAK